MRAWEFLTEGVGRKPPITLRHLNNLKQEQRWRQVSHQRRLKRTRAMYANTAWQREQLELERMELELEQLEAETEAIRAETRAADDEVISELARSGSEAMHRNEERVKKLARAAIHRPKKS